jgi:ribosomal protein S18 acetylase RimI-like enzyme
VEIEVKIVRGGDELSRLVDQINNSEWDDENDLEQYSVEALQAYIDTPDTVFITCQTASGEGGELLGMASARIELKPYQGAKWLYVDEVDVCSNHRGKGAGTALMKALIAFGEENNCEELWLGAEARNTIANKFYESLEPDDISPCIGYTFELDD